MLVINRIVNWFFYSFKFLFSNRQPHALADYLFNNKGVGTLKKCTTLVFFKMILLLAMGTSLANAANEVYTLNGHSSTICSLDYRKDGEYIASSSGDNTIRLWDISTGTCVNTFNKDHEGAGSYSEWISSAAYSPDGRIIASASCHGVVQLWDASAGECVKEVRNRLHSAYSLCYSPSGQYIAVASIPYGPTMHVWDITTEGLRYMHYYKGVNSIHYSPDEKYIASGGSDNNIKLWDATTGECVKTLEEHTHPVSSISYNSDGSQIVSGSRDKTIKIWSTSTGNCLHTIKDGENRILSVECSPSDQFIASGGYDGVKIWDASTGSHITTLAGHSKYIPAVTYSPCGNLIASGSADTTIKIWRTATIPVKSARSRVANNEE